MRVFWQYSWNLTWDGVNHTQTDMCRIENRHGMASVGDSNAGIIEGDDNKRVSQSSLDEAEL